MSFFLTLFLWERDLLFVTFVFCLPQSPLQLGPRQPAEVRGVERKVWRRIVKKQVQSQFFNACANWNIIWKQCGRKRCLYRECYLFRRKMQKRGGNCVSAVCYFPCILFFFSFLWHSTGETKTATASYFREKKTWFCSPKDQIQHRSHSHGARGVGRKKKRNERTHWFSSSDSTIALISRTFFLFFFSSTLFIKRDWS